MAGQTLPAQARRRRLTDDRWTGDGVGCLGVGEGCWMETCGRMDKQTCRGEALEPESVGLLQAGRPPFAHRRRTYSVEPSAEKAQRLKLPSSLSCARANAR
jgi:hypothetical protein